jgi:hypothetical protein
MEGGRILVDGEVAAARFEMVRPARVSGEQRIGGREGERGYQPRREIPRDSLIVQASRRGGKGGSERLEARSYGVRRSQVLEDSFGEGLENNCTCLRRIRLDKSAGESVVRRCRAWRGSTLHTGKKGESKASAKALQ